MSFGILSSGVARAQAGAEITGTVTDATGAVVPNVDIRLTPTLGKDAALDLLHKTVWSVDANWPGTRRTAVDVTGHWPAFALPDGSELVSDPEILVVNVTEAPTEDAMEEEIDTEGAGVEEDISEEEADETGEASEAASGDSSDGGEAAGDSAENSDG